MKRYTLLFALMLGIGMLYPFTVARADSTDQPTVQSSWGQIKAVYSGTKPVPYTTERIEDTARGLKPDVSPMYATNPQCYMWRFPFCGSWQITCKYGCNRHTGADYYAIDWSLPGEQDFNLPVLAPASGWVVWSGYKGDYGNQVIVDTGNGILYRVAHLNWLRFSNSRQYVYQGQTLGGAGHTGAAVGTHIHFVVYKGAYIGNGSVSGSSFPQEGINGQWSLGVGSYYPSGQVCMSW